MARNNDFKKGMEIWLEQLKQFIDKIKPSKVKSGFERVYYKFESYLPILTDYHLSTKNAIDSTEEEITNDDYKNLYELKDEVSDLIRYSEKLTTGIEKLTTIFQESFKEVSEEMLNEIEKLKLQMVELNTEIPADKSKHEIIINLKDIISKLIEAGKDNRESIRQTIALKFRNTNTPEESFWNDKPKRDKLLDWAEEQFPQEDDND